MLKRKQLTITTVKSIPAAIGFASGLGPKIGSSAKITTTMMPIKIIDMQYSLPVLGILYRRIL